MAFSNHDVVPDSPINNFATLNPLGHGLTGTLAEGNLKYTSGNQHNSLRGNFYVSSGKWYWEVLLGSLPVGTHVGISSIDEVVNVSGSNIGNWQKLKAIDYFSGNGRLYYNNTNSGTWGSSFSTGDIIGVYLNMELKQLSFYKNNTLQASPIDLTSATYNLGTLTFTPRFDDGGGSTGGDVLTINFGQDHTFGGASNLPASAGSHSTDTAGASTGGLFAYQPPAGALALCTQNIPSGPIDIANDDVPSDYFKAVTWENSNSDVTVSLDFEADLIWYKDRNIGWAHRVQDSCRGWGEYMNTNGTGTSRSVDSGYTAKDINGDGFSFRGDYNGTSAAAKMVAWCWKAAGAPADNQALIINEDGSDGTMTTADLKQNTGASITPAKVSANRKSGFSIIRYEGPESAHNTSARHTIPHGLNSAPEFVICKSTTSTDNWHVYHEDMGVDRYIQLNLSNAKSPSDPAVYNGPHTDELVKIGGTAVMALAPNEFIMYAWHSVAGYSKFGSYVGNGSADGPYVELGFRPAWVMCKCISTSNNYSSWIMYDSARADHNPTGLPLHANSSIQEGKRTQGDDASSCVIDLLSNGFKLRNDWSEANRNNETFIYMAFAETPFNAPATAR